ncbi:hypothetical protein G7084_02920 [Weissella coleopterorum]|uniref:Integral membrane protein n=1 Tax=Weissella coleopterorum TaxID=2714949 RepID=A0A6G8AZH6_9LACO|nr:TIGR03766 family XrtG-associated glycosyltransferase [Weissella coleopterorum]QIL50362.1 hypothetical protein G7084_02920 [Weissella coleopterorum]
MNFNRKFIKFINLLVTILFYFFLLQMLYFAGSSSNLSLENVTWIALVLVVFVIYLYVLINTNYINIYKIFNSRTLLAWCFFGFVVILQVIFISFVHPAIGFDAGAIHSALFSPDDLNIRGYYSQYINNLSLLLVQHWLSITFHNSSWLFFNYIGLILVDLSVLINILIIWLIKRENTINLIYIQSIFLLFFPWIIISYSDIWVIPLVSLIYLFYSLIDKFRSILWVRIILDIGLIFTVILTYYIKPSSIVPIIAIVLIEIKRIYVALFIEHTIHWKYIFSFLLAMILMSGVGYGSFKVIQQKINTQSYIRVNPNLAVPAIHFISMGMSGDGGYNEKDALAMALLPNRQDKVNYSVRLLKQRLNKMGMWGYIKFLFMKQENNAADGTFAWLKEGHFFANNPHPTNFWQTFVYPEGKNLKNYKFLAQLFWVFLLFTLAFTKFHTDKWVQIFRISILGGLFYLLIFEGGRSRYMIQFLPAILLLSAYNSNIVWSFLNRGFRWVKETLTVD